ncbi:DEAD/DEAH box helicase [Candidatus Pacearchaeota archaeon]|nr:DEAD/DEAH box helicase [Candidatus Pacearchaeota archaeon]
MEKFKDLGLCEHVLKVISNKKFAKPSEIQEKTIPLVLEGKDIIAGSATGSGKTLAFGAGIIKNVKKGQGIQGLVLTPTRELAEQVACALEEFAYYKGLEVVPVYGGVSIVHQVKKLVYADIVVATPGRLLDHLKSNSIDLSKVDFLVLDEADRMWDMGFKDDVRKIVEACPKERQTFLFSATISRDLADFSEKYMKAPVEVSVKSYVDTSKLKQIYYDVRDGEKFSLLVHLLKSDKPSLAMVFCNTRRNADFVEKNLRGNGVLARVIHGGMDQKKRIRVLKEFSEGNVSVIVCTDVAARGLDIPGISHIYNYDLPSDPRDYVHRIGRTARAGESGLAVNILASRDYDNFSNVLRKNEGLEVARVETPRFERVRIEMVEDRRRMRSGGRPSRGRDSRGSRGQRSGSSRGDRRQGGRDRSRGISRGDGRRRPSVSRVGRGQRSVRRDRGDDDKGPRRVVKKSRDGFRGGDRRRY